MMEAMDTPPTIPQRAGESVKAYSALIAYAVMGAGRSLEKVRQKIGKSTVHLRLLERWSALYDWQARVQAYDAQLHQAALAAHADQYKRELETHRQESMQYGRDLCGVAVEMLATLRGQQKKIDYTPAALATISRALTVGLDLQAHALGLDVLMPKLGAVNDDQE